MDYEKESKINLLISVILKLKINNILFLTDLARSLRFCGFFATYILHK